MGNTYATTLTLLWFLLSSYGSQKSHITAFEFHALHLLGHRILEAHRSWGLLILWSSFYR